MKAQKRQPRLWRRAMLALPAVLGLAAIAAPAQAQVGPDGDDDIICLTIARSWSGLEHEQARILLEPVPYSFLARVRGDICTRVQLIRTSLLDWHIRHGNKDSAMAAMGFWENELRTDFEPGFDEEFSAEWERALRITRELLAQSVKDEPDWNANQRRNSILGQLRELGTLKDLNRLNGRVDSAEFVANEYIRAADAFQSIELVEAGARVDQVPRRIAAFLDSKEGIGEAEDLLAALLDNFSRSDRNSANLRALNLAVVEASIRRDQASIQKADAITRDIYSPEGIEHRWPDLYTFLVAAYEDDHEACRPDELNSLDGYQERCEKSDLEYLGRDFWFERTRLELIARSEGVPIEPLGRAVGPGRIVDLTVDLFIRGAWTEGMRYQEIDAPPEPVRLLLWAGEAEVARLGDDCSDDNDEMGRAIYTALARIVRAGSLTSASNNPRLYREYAEALVETYGKFAACPAVERESRFGRANINAQAFLANYDRLVEID